MTRTAFRIRCVGLVGLAAVLAATPLAASAAPQSGQKTFASPQAAVNALVTAIERDDEQARLEILGPNAKRIVSSGDPVEDAASRANFLQRYRQMHRLVKEPDGTTNLLIGAANWPMPIPLVSTGHAWYFDTEAGKREILYRRIGRNELSAIRVCEELAAAQKEYHALRGHYAEKLFSDAGRHNGLYWEVRAGEPRSPIGPLVASAVAAGYAPGRSSVPTPYRGYYYHTLSRQGPSAPGGARAYLVGGRMTGGFAFVAYPAGYRSSGVMTFIVSSDGVVYEKDLGKDTARIAEAMKSYDPDSSWRKTQD
ncbi:MAG TPA: DUF2950 domain-containing protein [Steroidobacteraceae bacterium]|nr:DUF2950 domain-containing protein [Steroidobacteraceae bacterium]